MQKGLNELYAALDSGTTRTALRLGHQLREKFPASDLIAALNAVAMDRSGDFEAARKIAVSLAEKYLENPIADYESEWFAVTLILRRNAEFNLAARITEKFLANLKINKQKNPNLEIYTVKLFAFSVLAGESAEKLQKISIQCGGDKAPLLIAASQLCENPAPKIPEIPEISETTRKSSDITITLALAAVDKLKPSTDRKAFYASLAKISLLKQSGRITEALKVLEESSQPDKPGNMFFLDGEKERLVEDLLSVGKVSGLSNTLDSVSQAEEISSLVASLLGKEGDRVFWFQSHREEISRLVDPETFCDELFELWEKSTPMQKANIARVVSGFGQKSHGIFFLQTALELFDSEPAEEDLTPGKIIAWIAAAEIFSTGDFNQKIFAFSFSKYCEKKFPDSAHFKLLNCVFAGNLNCFSLAQKYQKSLKIQNAQWRSLSWLFPSEKIPCPFLDERNEVNKTIAFFGNLFTDSVSQIELVINEGAIHRIPEISRSVQEASRSVVLRNSKIDAKMEISSPNSLLFDSDFSPFNFVRPYTESFARPKNRSGIVFEKSAMTHPVATNPWRLAALFDLEIYTPEGCSKRTVFANCMKGINRGDLNFELLGEAKSYVSDCFFETAFIRILEICTPGERSSKMDSAVKTCQKLLDEFSSLKSPDEIVKTWKFLVEYLIRPIRLVADFLDSTVKIKDERKNVKENLKNFGNLKWQNFAADFSVKSPIYENLETWKFLGNWIHEDGKNSVSSIWKEIKESYDASKSDFKSQINLLNNACKNFK